MGGGLVQHHLGVGGDVDAARPARAIDEVHEPDLDIGVRRDGDLETRLDLVVEPRDRHDAGAMVGLVPLGGPPDGLMAERPEGPAVEIAHVKEDSVGVFRPVGGPGGERQAVPCRVAGPGAGQQDDVAAVREETRVRRRVVERA